MKNVLERVACSKTGTIEGVVAERLYLACDKKDIMLFKFHFVVKQ
jgi:hypothetical protein